MHKSDTLEGHGRQTVDTRSTSGAPLKLWGITLQTSFVEGRWHQIESTRARHIFYVCAQKFAFFLPLSDHFEIWRFWDRTGSIS